jgi:hypothetical protein
MTLVVIHTDKMHAAQVADRKIGPKVQLDTEASPADMRADIEELRVNGAVPEPPPTTAELTFDRIATEAIRAGMVYLDDDYLRELWDRCDGANEPDGYDCNNIHAELNRRGLGGYCAV